MNFTLNTEKYKSVRYTDGLFLTQDYYLDKFPMLDTLEVEISEHPIPNLNNYKQASHIYNSRNRSCRLKISIYPGTDPIGFNGAIRHSLEQLSTMLTATSN